jgi:ABC-type transport system involved in multi-copper enzyme maturation permease subunit
VNLAIAGIRKFRTRTATIVSLIIAVILVVLEFVLVGVSYRSATASTSGGVDKATFDWLLTFPGAYEAVLALAFEFLGIIGLIYVVTAAGSEWTWGTLKVAVARGQSRWQYTVATFASLGFILLIGLLITFAAGVAAAAIGGSIAGLPIGNPADPSELAQVLVKLAREWIALMGLTSLGYAVAMVARSQMAGIGTVIGYFIVSIIGPALLPDFVKEAFKYLPFSIAADSVGLMAPSSSGGIASASVVEPNLALLVTIGWLVGCLLVASIFVERAEISG